jgi:hypothetical protein
VGRALYEGRFTLAEAIERVASARARAGSPAGGGAASALQPGSPS